MVPEIVDGQQRNRQKTGAEPQPPTDSSQRTTGRKDGPRNRHGTKHQEDHCIRGAAVSHGIRTSRVRPRQHRREDPERGVDP